MLKLDESVAKTDPTQALVIKMLGNIIIFKVLYTMLKQ